MIAAFAELLTVSPLALLSRPQELPQAGGMQRAQPGRGRGHLPPWGPGRWRRGCLPGAPLTHPSLLPEVADRNPREQWQAMGALDAHARAMQHVRDILTRDNPATFSPGVDARIRAEFEGLVAGDAAIEWPSAGDG